MSRSRIPKRRRWLANLLPALLVLAGGAGWAALVLGSATLAQAHALEQVVRHIAWHPHPPSAAAWYATRWALGAAALVLAGAAGNLLTSTAGRPVARAWRRDLRRAAHSWWQSLTGLPPAQARWAGGALALLTAGRLYFSLTTPWHIDELASYQYFVSRSLLAVGADYPMPNNHVLANVLAWAFYQISPSGWWTLRLPVLLAATAGTALLFAGTLRRAGFGVALLATGLFAGLQLSWQYAAVGRGYWLLIALAAVVFFATLRLAETGGRGRAAWAALVLGGVAGGYVMPAFAYVLASAGSWLGWQLWRQRQGAALGHLAGAGLLGAAALALLYAPVLLVSGPGALLGNGYVQPLPLGRLVARLPAYLWGTEGLLAGQQRLGAALTLGVVLATVWPWWPGGPASALPDPTRPLAAAALWFLLLPDVLLLAQRVLPPERVLLYKAFFLFLLLARLVGPALARRPRWRGPLVAVAVVFLAYQLYHVERLNRRNARAVAAYHAAFRWLARQPPRPLLLPSNWHYLYFSFYARTETPGRPWQADRRARPGVRYGYVATVPGQREELPPQSSPPVFQNAAVAVWRR